MKKKSRGSDKHNTAPIYLTIRDALPVTFPHRVLISERVGFGESPLQLARLWIKSDYMPSVIGDRDERSIYI